MLITVGSGDSVDKLLYESCNGNWKLILCNSLVRHLEQKRSEF